MRTAVRRVRTPRVLAPVLVGVLALTGCSEGDASDAARTAQSAADKAADAASKGADRAKEELAGVDWSKYGREAKRRLDRLAAKADCPGLKKELAKAEGDDAALTRYIKQRIRQADCPGS